MYCPRCSQEQNSEELKFCSRCGFPLVQVAEVLAHDGVLPPAMVAAMLDKPKTIFTRRNGLIFTLFWFMFFVLILTPLFGGVVRADALAQAAALLGTMGGLMLLLASFILLKNDSRPEKPMLDGENAARPFTRNLSAPNQNALPAQQSIPISDFAQNVGGKNRRGTKDLIQPSVTEYTTKLLRKEEN